MENVWLSSALWLGLALAASIVSIRVAMTGFNKTFKPIEDDRSTARTAARES